jgi:hypothetical protein
MAEFDPGRVNVFRGRHVIVDFQMDRKGMARCAMGPELADAVHSVVEDRAMPYAIGISPVSDRNHEHYVEAFSTIMGTATIRSLRRVAALLINSSPHAAAVEWGNARTDGKGHRVLGRTLDHLNGVHGGN